MINILKSFLEIILQYKSVNIVIVMLCRFSRYQHLQLASKRDLEMQLT